MTTKHAQDLNINDMFRHDELQAWKVIEQPVIPTGVTIKVKAMYQGKSQKVKVFNFGRLVTLDMVNS